MSREFFFVLKINRCIMQFRYADMRLERRRLFDRHDAGKGKERRE
jgi:hypothetical protein